MIKTTFEKLLLLGLIVFFFSACTNVKKLVYFQRTNNASDTIAVAKAYVPKIEPGDILSIYVNSLSPEASSFFNPYAGGSSLGSSGTAGSSSSTGSGGGSSSSTPGPASDAGYLVDPSGQIEMPLIGSIKVSGYTTTQLKDTLKTLLKTYLKDPTVLVRFVNFKISILGEVAHPGVYNIPNERITLPEAISIAGDLTLFARRDSIEIIRDVNEKKVFGYVDFNRRDMFNSPYYYLHANDLVYVKPSKTKTEQTDRTFQYVSIGISFLTLVLLAIRTKL